MFSSDVNLKINLHFKGCIAEMAGEGGLTPMLLSHVLIQAALLCETGSTARFIAEMRECIIVSENVVAHRILAALY
jgi:hypothetical protein